MSLSTESSTLPAPAVSASIAEPRAWELGHDCTHRGPLGRWNFARLDARQICGIHPGEVCQIADGKPGAFPCLLQQLRKALNEFG